MDYAKYIQDIQEKLSIGKMSVMIGSGFSKNISRSYPSWGELLYSLVIELYEKQFLREYHSTAGTLRKKMPLTQYLKERSYEILEQQGYLEVVSEFIKKKGVERITTYIEDHIPYAQVRDNKLILTHRDTTEKVELTKLKLHREIVELPWNNIYTTNYDNLLELCADEERFDQLQKQIDKVNIEIEDILLKIKTAREELTAVEEQDQHSPRLTEAVSSLGHEPYTAEQTNEKDKLRRDLHQFNMLLDSKQEQIQQTKIKQANAFSIVTDAGKLRLKRNNNIIKLHGSLRSPEERTKHIFGFDGDHKKHYIICREDYDGYPKKHEAFTQLMRISLLQESFCLIGFSANDPNFIAWISWVRDILQRHALDEKQKDIKIYLIDTSNQPLSEDKLLFFENYSIKRIPISDPEVIQLITKDKDKQISGEIDQLLFALLEYFGDHKNAKVNIKLDDVANQTEWQEIWKREFFPIGTSQPNKHQIATALEQLRSFKKNFILPRLVQAENGGPEQMINRYAGLPEKIAELPEVLELVAYAIRDSTNPISPNLSPETIAVFKAKSKLRPLISEALAKNDIATGNLDRKITKFPKLEAYRLAFSFQFIQLRRHLDDWHATDKDILVKGGLLSFLSPREGFEYLNRELETNFTFRSELKLYLLELMGFVETSILWRSNRKFSRYVSAYEQLKLKGIRNRFKTIIEGSRLSLRKKIYPYDKGRFSVSRNKSDDLPDPSLSIDIIMTCLETGFNLNIESNNIIDSRDWYPMFKSGFAFYPQTFLFYALQIGDKEYIKRIAQDYCHDDHIDAEERKQITEHLFASCIHAPNTYQQKIFQFLGTFINSVPPIVWEDDFIKLWRYYRKKKTAFVPAHRNNFFNVAATAFRYMVQEKNLVEVLKDCILVADDKKIPADHREITVDLLYNLNKNVHLKEMGKTRREILVLDPAIDKLIASFTLRGPKLFILANIQYLLTSEQRKEIAERLALLSYENINDTRKLDVAMYFGHSHPEVHKKLKSTILDSHLLWHTGFNGIDPTYKRRSYSVSTPIQLSYLSQSKLRKDGLIWNNDEVLQLYQKLTEKIPDLDGHLDRNDPFFNYVDLCEEIKWFTDTYCEKLKDETSFRKIKKFADDLYANETNYEQVIDGLLSNEHSEVIWALSEMSKDFYTGNASKKLIQFALNKILLQSGPALEATLSYISSWLTSEKGTDCVFDDMDLLTDILRKYLLYPIDGHDQAFVEECLIKIAQYLKAQKVTNDILDLWLKKGRDSRYNNVRQHFTY